MEKPKTKLPPNTAWISLLFVAIYLAVSGCGGLTDPKVVIHKDRPANGTIGQGELKKDQSSESKQQDEDSDLGLKVFRENVSPIIDNNCITCHQNIKISDNLLAQDPTTDRGTLVNYLENDCSDLSLLTEKLSGAVFHFGGIQTEFLDAVNIWAADDPMCQ